MTTNTCPTSHYFINTILVAGLILLAGCKKFEYSPYQTEPTADNLPSGLNEKNISKLLAQQENHDDTITFVYSGDSQRFYANLERLVNKVNALPSIDFLIISGDIADFGLLQEYLWVYERLKDLQVPYLCAIGNHDFAANAGDIYTTMFGEKNYSFKYKGYKFIFHDTNGREYNFNGTVPNIPWLNTEMNDAGASWLVGVSHVPPYDEDFDNSLEQPYRTLFASKPNFVVSLHGHLHDRSDSYYYGDGVRYMTSNAVGKDEFVLLKLINGTILKQVIAY